MDRIFTRIIVANLILLFAVAFLRCTTPSGSGRAVKSDSVVVLTRMLKVWSLDTVIIIKKLLYDKYTVADTFLYKKAERHFQWDKIRTGLRFIDSLQWKAAQWAVLQNKNNSNGASPLVPNYRMSDYDMVEDSYGVERYQSVPLYAPGERSVPFRYGRDGSLVKLMEDTTGRDTIRIATTAFGGEWDVPRKYLKLLVDTIVFNHTVFVDRRFQIITTLERTDTEWLVRSMNPATTGLRLPPYRYATPLGMYVLQEKRERMLYLQDGTTDIEGLAPYASRFCNGAYIHGIPLVDSTGLAPESHFHEYSYSLGTTPKSHMCVRVATSHAKFIFDWAPVDATLVFVIE